MKRNPVVPFILIMVFGIALMFLLSFKGLGDMKEVAKGEGKSSQKTETAATNPEDIYKSTCIGCHGDQYQGGVGPSLKGVGKKLSKDEIKGIIKNGRNNMPAQTAVTADQLDKMAEWVSKIQ
ncbi:cytochrome c [Neobacillus sp. OS1-32]|uniref:cytochrome c550 n=1 Tax=Neobacillus sp. OS1-32 TaxID=3070682 RepID=UPI0027DFAFC0|nr:cytochrome c [Neobacillus sp. OS1-32]WML30675.1 cytochrome c [Neobacillus sp. OS1-32]